MSLPRTCNNKDLACHVAVTQPLVILRKDLVYLLRVSGAIIEEEEAEDEDDERNEDCSSGSGLYRGKSNLF